MNTKVNNGYTYVVINCIVIVVHLDCIQCSISDIPKYNYEIILLIIFWMLFTSLYRKWKFPDVSNAIIKCNFMFILWKIRCYSNENTTTIMAFYIKYILMGSFWIRVHPILCTLFFFFVIFLFAVTLTVQTRSNRKYIISN